MNLETLVGKLLQERSLTLAVAESCTGGLISKRITDVPGASRYFKLGLIPYSIESKQKILKISKLITPISIRCAYEMAAKVRKLANVDIGLAITGNTEPNPLREVHIAFIADDNQFRDRSRTYHEYDKYRSDVRWEASTEALLLIRDFLS